MFPKFRIFAKCFINLVIFLFNENTAHSYLIKGKTTQFENASCMSHKNECLTSLSNGHISLLGNYEQSIFLKSCYLLIIQSDFKNEYYNYLLLSSKRSRIYSP